MYSKYTADLYCKVYTNLLCTLSLTFRIYGRPRLIVFVPESWFLLHFNFLQMLECQTRIFGYGQLAIYVGLEDCFSNNLASLYDNWPFKTMTWTPTGLCLTLSVGTFSLTSQPLPLPLHASINAEGRGWLTRLRNTLLCGSCFILNILKWHVSQFSIYVHSKCGTTIIHLPTLTSHFECLLLTYIIYIMCSLLRVYANIIEHCQVREERGLLLAPPFSCLHKIHVCTGSNQL